MKLLDLFENESKSINNVKIQLSIVDFHHGQLDGYILALVHGEKIGYLDFSIYDNVAQIKMIEVDPQYRRLGVGMQLVKRLEQEVGKHNIEWGGLTTDGAAFKRHWEQSIEEDSTEVNNVTEARTSKKINESFDRPYTIRWEKSELSNSHDALATLDDGTSLAIMFNDEGNDEWRVDFYRDNSQEITGKGDAVRVFATVLHAIQQFIKKEKPQCIIFAASKDVEPGQNSQSRSNLYNSLVARYASAWGYDAYEEDQGDQITYELTRKTRNISEASSNKSKLVYRIDQTKITDFEKNMRTYHHNDDWTQSGSKWPGATGSAKGIFAHPSKRFIALYAAGNSDANRFVATYDTSPPTVYFDKKDVPKFENTKSYLTAFDANNFKIVPSGEAFSEHPGKPVSQEEIHDPFKFIQQQGWTIESVDDLTAKFKQIQTAAKEKGIKYGAEGMDTLEEALGYIRRASAQVVPDDEIDVVSESQLPITIESKNYSNDKEEKFIAELLVDGKDVGNFFVFHRFKDNQNPNRIRVANSATINTKQRGQGLGKLLLLAAITAAAHYGINFEKDDKGVSPPQRKVYDSLEQAGYIVQSKATTDAAGFEHKFWTITANGTDYLNSQATWHELNENFADGRGPGKPGDSARLGIPKHATLAQLDRMGRGSGRKAQLARWQANMRRGRRKK
jgi:GNAT superfamily N-acetyltransferase